MERDVTFSKFRPFCAALASKPSKEILEKLDVLVSASNPQDLVSLQEYIIFPCQVYLKTPIMPENYTIQVLKFVEHFFCPNGVVRVELNSTFLMTDLLQSILMIMSGSNQSTETSKVELSEDFKISICDCVSGLVKSSTTDVKSVIYSVEQKLAVSHLVFQVLEWSQSCVRNVIVSCLEMIDNLCCRDNPDDLSNKIVYTQFVNQFCQMLPGITTKLVKTLQQQNSNKIVLSNKIIVKCLTVWRHYVVSIFCDKNIDQELTTDLTKMSDKCQLLSDTTWIGKAQDHLMSHVQIFGRSFSTHSNILIREELLRLCSDLIENCSTEALTNLHSLLIEILSALAVDQDSDILRDNSKKCLRKLLQIFAEKQKARIVDQILVDESSLLRPVAEQAQLEIFNLCEKLSNRSKILQQFELDRDLSKLHGFLGLLKEVEVSSTFFQSETYVSQLLDALLCLATFENDAPYILSSNSYNEAKNSREKIFGSPDSCDFIFEPELYLTFRRPEKLFKHLTTPGLVGRFNSVVQSLPTSLNVSLIVDHLVDKLFDKGNRTDIDNTVAKDSRKAELIFLLNEIIRGISLDRSESYFEDLRSLEDILDQICNAYLNFEPEKIQTSEIVPTKNPGRTSSDKGWNSINSLITEGFGLLALAAQAFDVEKSFARENLGLILVHILVNNDPCQTLSADILFATLQDLTQAFHFSDIPSMLSAHYDHLCRDLCILLRRHLTRRKGYSLGERPRGLRLLLNVILKLQAFRCSNLSANEESESVSSDRQTSNFSPSPELGDIMSVLLDQLDISWLDPDQSVTREILSIILTFVLSFQKKGKDEKIEEIESVQRSDDGILTKMIEDLIRSDQLLESEQFDDEDMEACPDQGFHQEKKDPDADAEVGGTEAKPISDQVAFLKKTIEHTRHFISMVQCPHWQLTALEIVANAVLIIKLDQDTLLPLIHQAWQPLKLLFDSDNIFVVAKAFEALSAFAVGAKDFIHRRTLTDVFPAIVRYLKKLKNVVNDRRMQSTLLARQSRVLLQEMIRGLWNFMELLSLSESEVEPIINEMVDYVTFSRKHSKLFDNSTIGYFEPDRQTDSDILWLKLSQISSL